MSSLPDSGFSIQELGVLFDQLPVGLVLTDREVRTTRTNAAYRRLVGLPDQALIGHRLSEVAPEADVVLAERILAEQVINRGVSVSNVPMEQTVAGRCRVLSWSADRMMDSGEVVGAVVSVTDVTDRVQADRALRRANARLDLLQRAGCQVGTTLDVFRTAGELAGVAVPGLADRATVELCEAVLQGEDPPSDPGALRVRRVAVRDAATRSAVGFAVGDLITVPIASVTGLAAWRGEPFLARNWTEMSGQVHFTSDHARALLSRGVHTLMLVPLVARGAMLGMAAFCRAENPEPYDEEDLRLVSDLTSRAAVHIDNARLYTREHTTAIALQRSLLPRHIPPLAGLEVAYRYQPASQAAEVGGDWFDVIALDGGQVALVVGDVTGHGIHAAALMGELRTTTAALAHRGCPPGQIMVQLSGMVAVDGDEAGATCLYAVYDPASRRCRLTSAGHLPPALRHPGGSVEFLDLPGGVMLGAAQGDYPVTDTDLPAGSVLALYTDGLIEQPGQDLSTGMSQLARALAADPARSPDQLCDSVLASTGPHAHARDDIALLLARTTEGPKYSQGQR
jgi:PAS domain S-box-containing protein